MASWQRNERSLHPGLEPGSSAPGRVWSSMELPVRGEGGEHGAASQGRWGGFRAWRRTHGLGQEVWGGGF